MRKHWSSIACVVALGLAGCSGGGGNSPAHLPVIPPATNSGSSSNAATPPHYTITDLGANVQPNHINDTGVVVGQVSNANAFVWTNGSLHTLAPLPTYTTASAQWVNNSGEIVGTSYGNPNTNWIRATRWTMAGAATNLGAPPSDPNTAAYSVNDGGLIVGAAAQQGYIGPSWSEITTFDGNGTATPIASSWGGEAYAVNNAGTMVGATCCPYGFPDQNTEAFVYPPFTMLTMPSNAGEGAEAYDINTAGHVVGIYNLPGPTGGRDGNQCCVGFFYHNGTMTEIDDPTSAGMLEPLAINDSDWIVGYYGGSVGYITQTSAQAFIYIGKVVNLNTLLPANCGWSLVEATSINASGQIVGVGLVNGTPHGFLLTPQH